MILFALRIQADALRSPFGGVQKQLEGLQLDPLLDQNYQPPAIKAILDPTTNIAIAADRVALDWPFVAVTIGEDAFVSPSDAQQRQDFRAPLTVWYGTRTVDEDIASVETMYALDAIVASINWLSKPDQAADRRRGRVGLITILELTYGPVDPFKIKGTTFRGRVRVVWKGRNTVTA